MAKTRAQCAAKSGRDPLYQDQEPRTRKRQRLNTHQKSSKGPKGNGRKQAIEDLPDLVSESSPNCRQISREPVPELSNAATEHSAKDKTAPANADWDNSIDFWRREGRWPRRYFEPEAEHLLARKRPLSALGGPTRMIPASSTTPSDQKPREEKSAQYRDPQYETLLATKGCFMIKSETDVASESKKLCKLLLETEQKLPENSLFRDDLFDSTCRKVHDKNEARIIQDISRLIVPSAESLATYGAEHLEILAESINEGWNNSIPLVGTRPQPDYSVGFRREAFTKEQLEKLSPFVGDFIAGDLSYFMATYYMYFPFLTCEVKCGGTALNTADRQNAHSMTLMARGIVELLRLVNRQGEVQRQILAFSFSHDHRSVRIYGIYPVININSGDTEYYRHPIRTFDFTEMDGKEKWSAYRFTKNIYDTWMPEHFKRISSAIDQLPSKVDFDVPRLSESTGFSQGLEIPVQSEYCPPQLVDEGNKAARPSDTPATSFSNLGPAKRRKCPAENS